VESRGGAPLFPKWGHIGRAKCGGIDGVEIVNQGADFGGGGVGLGFVADAAKDEGHRDGLGSAGGVDQGGGAEVGLEVGHPLGIDFKKARSLVGEEADLAGFIFPLGKFHLPDKSDGGVGGSGALL